MSKWKDLLTFTKQERNGIAVLAVLLVGAVAYLFLQPVLFQPASVPTDIPAGYTPHMNAPQPEAVRIEKEKTEVEVAFMAGQRSLYQQNELFLFDPNGLAESDWVRLGLSPAQARSVKNFESKGGNFRYKEDVKKLYVISPEKYSELEPYIVLPEKSDSLPRYEKKRETIVMELNTADTTQLKKVDGIGSFLAARIVERRYFLGGFHSKEQLLEVYGFDEEKYKQVESSFTCDPSYVVKINVNTAQVADLKKHPYFTPGIANALVNYRKQHGNYQTLPDILKCKLITPVLYEKLSPYLTL